MVTSSFHNCHDDYLFHHQLVPFPPGVKIEQLSLHPEGKHYLALTKDREVYSWGLGENGRLGLGETR